MQMKGTQGACRGQYLNVAVVETDMECLAQCKSDPNCKFYNFKETFGVNQTTDPFCILLKDCPSISQDYCAECSYGNRNGMTYEEGMILKVYLTHQLPTE